MNQLIQYNVRWFSMVPLTEDDLAVVQRYAEDLSRRRARECQESMPGEGHCDNGKPDCNEITPNGIMGG